MMKRFLVAALAVALLAGFSPARAGQLVNGNFATGDFTGWTLFTTANGTNGHPPLPNVVSFDTAGMGASLAAHFQVGQVVFTPGVPAGGGLFQSVMLGTGTLNIDADIASQNISGATNVAGGIFQVLLDGVVVDTHDFGQINNGDVLRSTLHFSTAVTAGPHEIRFLMTRPFLNGSSLNDTPLQYLDNARLSGTAVEVTAVPEPGSLALLGAGALSAVSYFGWRRRRSAAA
jgi:hypothetical protein